MSLDVRTTRSTCPYCGVGCGVLIDTDGDGADTRVVGVRGDPDHPANLGRLCTKGSTLHLTATPLVRQQQRLLRPAWRATRDDALQPQEWDTTTRRIADQLLAIRAEHGPDSVGFYISGQLLTEDYYAFNKLARGLVGTNNIDSNSRLCMSSAVVGYKQPGRRRTADLLRGPRAHRLPVHRGRQHRVGASDPVPPHRGRARGAARPEDHRRRSAPHRDGGVRRPAPGAPARHRRRAVPRHAAYRGDLGRLDRCRIHRSAHPRLRRAEGAGAHDDARRIGPSHRAEGGRPPAGRALVLAVAGDAVAVLHGAEPEQRRQRRRTPR